MNRFRKHIRKKFSGYEPEVNDLWLHENWKQTEQLLNKKNESRDRLTNFEPDADDAFIEEKWKAIIPYLPEEKKRRAVLYIPTGCLLPGALLMTPVILFVLYYFTGYIKTTANLSEKGGEQHQLTGLAAQQTQKAQSKTAASKSSGLIASGSGINSSHRMMDSGSSKTNQPYKQLSSVPGKSSDLSGVVGKITDGELRFADSICLLYPVSCFPDRLVSDSLLKQVSATSDSVPVKKASRFMVDVTTGMTQLFPKVQFDSLPGMSGRKTALCLSAALHYKLHQRLLLSTQFALADNRYDYRSADTQNFILSRTPSTTSTLPGSIDSSIQYIPFERIRRLQSTFNCLVGAGMEVQLFNRNKLTLSAGLLLQLSMTQFKYGYSYQPTGDTLSYIKHTTSPPLPNTTQVTEPENRSATFLKTNLGICPGLVIGYKVSKHIDLIAKPAVYVDLKELKPLQVGYKQTNFLLTAGVRIKL